MLHAEELEDAPGWAVTVHDDGIGFDPKAAQREEAALDAFVSGGKAAAAQVEEDTK